MGVSGIIFFYNVVAYIIKWSMWFFFFFFVFLIVDGIGDPIWSLGHSVVDTGLTAFCTWVTGWHDAYKGPPALNFGHERTPRIPLTRVFAPTIVASTDHFVIDYDVDALVSMPPLTLSIFNHRNIHYLKKNYKKSDEKNIDSCQLNLFKQSPNNYTIMSYCYY